jgi:hypothetical protein
MIEHCFFFVRYCVFQFICTAVGDKNRCVGAAGGLMHVRGEGRSDDCRPRQRFDVVKGD